MGRTGEKHQRVDTAPNSKLVVKLPLAMFNEMEAWCLVHGMTKTEFVRQATNEKLGRQG